MNAVERGPSDAREAVAGLMASAAIFVALLGVAYRPVRIIPAAIIVALIASRMTERHRGLAAAAVAIGALAWTVGMAVAVVTESPLY